MNVISQWPLISIVYSAQMVHHEIRAEAQLAALAVVLFVIFQLFAGILYHQPGSLSLPLSLGFSIILFFGVLRKTD